MAPMPGYTYVIIKMSLVGACEYNLLSMQREDRFLSIGDRRQYYRPVSYGAAGNFL